MTVTQMTIAPHAPRTVTEQATFSVQMSEAPVITTGILPGELEVLADKVVCAQHEAPAIMPATGLLLSLIKEWGMSMTDATAALRAATEDGEHTILHI